MGITPIAILGREGFTLVPYNDNKDNNTRSQGERTASACHLGMSIVHLCDNRYNRNNM